MTIIYVATNANILKVIEIDDETGEFVRVIQEIDPVVIHPFPTLAPNSSTADNGDDRLVSYLGIGKISTEWIERHPTFPLLYVFTSFFNKAVAIVTSYRIIGIDGNNKDDIDKNSIKNRSSFSSLGIRGRLKKLGSIQTGGFYVSHVTFSPNSYSNGSDDKNKVMCVAHYMDGSISFFDCDHDGALTQPIRTVVIPEVRSETRNTAFPNYLPSIHHVTYNPRPQDTNNNSNEGKEEVDICRYLLVSDTSKQGRVWTYTCNSRGLPISDKPDSFRKVTYINPPPGWLSRITNYLAGLADYRIRRCVVHPNGQYVYLLLEFNAVIQVYEINSFTGKISGDCLQEVPTIDPEYFGSKYKSSSSSSSSKFTGIALHAPAELLCTASELFVTNRGFNYGGRRLGQAESGVRVFTIEDDGAKLVPKQELNCYGPVRHCLLTNNPFHAVKLYAGSDKERRSSLKNGNNDNDNENNNYSSASIETFVRRQPEACGGMFERLGSAKVGMDNITCISILE